MKEAARNLTLYLVMATTLVTAGGCRFLPEFSDDEEIVTAERRTFVRLDEAQIPAADTDPALSPLQQDVIERQIAFLTDFVRDANEWYLPFASSYLPSLRTGQEKRIIPVRSNGPLASSLNQRDIVVSLSAPGWSGDFSSAIPLLRQELIRSAVNRILKDNPAASFPQAEQQKADLVRRIFAQGVPVYLSSFGMRAGDSPLTFALTGERDLIEEQFRILREMPDAALGMTGNAALGISGNDSTAASVDAALTRAGLWMCHKIESLSGTQALIQAVQEGPRSLYDHYLATRPGILLSLEPVPVQTTPFPGDIFITH